MKIKYKKRNVQKLLSQFINTGLAYDKANNILFFSCLT